MRQPSPVVNTYHNAQYLISFGIIARRARRNLIQFII